MRTLGKANSPWGESSCGTQPGPKPSNAAVEPVELGDRNVDGALEGAGFRIVEVRVEPPDVDEVLGTPVDEVGA